MLISENYRALNKGLHASNPGYGTSGSKRASDVERFAQKLNAQSILDYGCGKQTLGKALPHLPIIAYDPAIPELANPPMPADLVVCTDVLEHIEPELLENVLDDLKRLTIKGIFIVVSTCAAKKFLADGRNAHLIQQPSGWWLPKLMVRWDINQFQVAENEFSMFGLASRETVVQDVSQEDQVAARIAVKNLWKQKIERWKTENKRLRRL
jgi:hypothetical protein